MRKKLRSIRRMLALFLIILCLLALVLTLPRLMSRKQKQRQKLAARLMQKHLQWMVKACGLRLHIHGRLPPEGESFVLLSNHVSYWDILALGSLAPLGFLAKDSIAQWPVLGTVTSLCNTIYVSREDVRGRWRSLRSLQVRSRDMPYCIFPEGTTTAGALPKLALWHRGNIAVLRKPGIPIWTAGLHYKEHTRQAWIDDDALLPHLYKTMQADTIDLTIHLQRLEHEAEESLRQLSLRAWSQTVKLCRSAQETSCRPVRIHPEIPATQLFTYTK